MKQSLRAFALCFILFLPGCATFSGEGDPKADYVFARELYNEAVRNITLAINMNEISKEDARNKIYPVILTGRRALDQAKIEIMRENYDAAQTLLQTLQAATDELLIYYSNRN